MRDHSTTETLERVVGPERASHTPRVVARAERELSLRGGTEEAAFQRKLRLGGTLCAVAGVFCAVWPVLLLTAFSRFGPTDRPSNPELPFMFRHFDQIFIAVGVLQTFVGLLLLAGGILVRSRRLVGPRLVAAALYFVLFYILAFTVTLIPSIGSSGFARPSAVVFVLLAVLNSFAWAFTLWLPLRFFTSPRVRLVCSRATV